MNIIPTASEIKKCLTYPQDRKSKLKVRVTQDIYLKIHGVWYVIPKGLVSDGASIPFLFTWILGRFNPHIILFSLWHDYGYACQFAPRIVIDTIYRAGLSLTAHPVLAFVFYWLIRIFGIVPWLKHKRSGLRGYAGSVKRMYEHVCKVEVVKHTYNHTQSQPR